MSAFSESEEQTIQGIGLARFRKDHQELLFLRFGAPAGARRLLGELAPRVASLWEVKRFNDLFSEVSGRVAGGQEGVVEATWVGLGIAARGYRALGVNLDELGATAGAEAFKEGMAKRSAEHVGDRAEDQPENWLDAFKTAAGVDAIVVVAADDEGRLDRAIDRLCRQVHDAGAEVVFQERGDTLPEPFTGHEHFGFKDGISQPAVEGFDAAPGEHEPPAVPAGEFVLGHPNHAGPSPIAGDLWTNGSYGVFRRLRQNVAEFRAQAAAIASPTPAAGQAATPPLSAQQIEAKFVGRWPSGAPTDLSPESDPGESGISNAFDFASDAEGQRTPRFGHIRKVNPRQEERADREQAPAQNHRMIRAGIPYGDPLPPGVADDDADRGLHFLCIVSDLDAQFEFVQREWASNANFPNGSKPGPNSPYGPPAPGTPADGVDPLIGAHAAGDTVSLHQPGGIHALALLAETVRVTAGEYFFYPSIHAIQRLAEGATTSS
jgi:Dyp-type peroxidase family